MLPESTIIDQLAALRTRSPLQKNRVHETDAEIIEVGGQLFALTTDTLFEELDRGLIIDPYATGWISVLMSLSDLSAVGATPVGILLGLNLPKEISKDRVKLICKGIEDCCRKHQTFILGGDTNHTDKLSISTTALGKFEGTKYLGRTPLIHDSPLYVSGTVGTGNLAAFLNINNQGKDRLLLRKEAQIELGKLLLKFDGKAIDTSDGLLFTLTHLFSINEVGFSLDASLFPYAPPAPEILKETGLTCEILALGEVGDYELLFTVPGDRRVTFEEETKKRNLKVTLIGKTTDKKEITINSKLLDLQALKTELDRASNNEEYLRIIVGEISTWSEM